MINKIKKLQISLDILYLVVYNDKNQRRATMLNNMCIYNIYFYIYVGNEFSVIIIK